MTIPSNWYEHFFHGVPLDLWRKAISPEQTKTEADFLVAALRCDVGARLLDLPCGNGRLSFELARRGYRVTGVDISEEFIAEARKLVHTGPMDPPAGAGGTDGMARASGAGTTGEAAGPQFLIGDMRKVEGESIYDGAFCFGNSFGFLEYADMEKFLNGVARALKPGARFVIETGMAAESVLGKFEKETSHQIDDIFLTIKERYIADQSCIDSEYIFERDGKTESRKAKHWIYTVGEIRRMLERAGFAVKEICGSLDRKPYELGSTELFVIAVR